ncbi:hypothetical protein RFI_39897 [Reticulomyxa filosa]|uniref:Reverse transcriptase domain-containing protein n=1 Tax=Reticulomyxa filosa TaxID=46433 RepID=X6L7A5_RETFI|nr:hypothetical protein RFI_39897 [Reticulomyxa filosa]|eukprot:ETN97632.1 hypothetical protein RFI_39897 [Reticulomyxa filosa]
MNIIKWISQKKAQGPDNIHNQMIKNGGQSLIDSLVVLFNWSSRLDMSKIMEASEYCSNSKPDRDHSICKNYRPISLSGVEKLLERIITMILMWYLNESKLLHQCQAGFQSWHNTSELLLRLSAYDSAWRERIWMNVISQTPPLELRRQQEEVERKTINSVQSIHSLS